MPNDDTSTTLEAAQREAAAYKWAYEYLQDRMRSIDRPGWAEDCDGEIESRMKAPAASATSPVVKRPRP